MFVLSCILRLIYEKMLAIVPSKFKLELSTIKGSTLLRIFLNNVVLLKALNLMFEEKATTIFGN